MSVRDELTELVLDIADTGDPVDHYSPWAPGLGGLLCGRRASPYASGGLRLRALRSTSTGAGSLHLSTFGCAL